MGKQVEHSPPEPTKSLSTEKSPRSPRSANSRGTFKADKYESPIGSLSKTNDSPRLSLAFSSSSVNNISPTGANHSRSVSKQLDFSSPGSVSSKGGGYQVSPRGVSASSKLQLDLLSAGLGNSQRFSENESGDVESVAEYTCGSISVDELRQMEQILHASGGRLEELYKKVNLVK